MRFDVISLLLGRLVSIVGCCLIIPMGVSIYYQERFVAWAFLMTLLLTEATGGLLMVKGRAAKKEFVGLREGFLLVSLIWLVLSLLGAVPFYVTGIAHSFVDAFFESASGFTTTGASVLSNLHQLPKGIAFWRSFTHWIGGMGIIVLAVAIFPQLSIGGMQLMKNEMPGPSFEQLKPRIKQTAMSLWKVYMLFSVLQVAVLYALGMPLFDSFCHMFGTMGTGGFSTYDASVGAYTPGIQMAVAVFMFLAGMNFVLHYAWLHGDWRKLVENSEFRFYTGLLLASCVLIVGDLTLQHGTAFLTAVRDAVFQAVSICTSTGFATTDFDQWPVFSKGILFLLMLVGGCAGSTGGGMKQVRLLLLFKISRQSIVHHIFPKAVVPVKLDRKRVIPQDVLNDVSSFLLMYLVIVSICTLMLLAFRIDFVTALSAVVACLSNIGPGFGLVGPMQNYAFMPDVLKLLLSLCMIIGRLEIFTVLVLLFPSTWRK